uniref:Capsid triplex subunit 2 n=1 Tax=Acipenser herpesvirus 2 TaxID=3078846 RepID=A0AA96RS97_9VIRU|nr:capsid triplex subunit 2 [Acipenser herpesvirus 2]
MTSVTAFLSPLYSNNIASRGAQPAHVPNLTSISVRDTDIPKGVFVPIYGNKYLPTIHGTMPPIRGVMGLTQTGGSLNEPITLEIMGGKMYTVLNTGVEPLRVGDHFTVEYPTAQDVEAQLKVKSSPSARKMCSAKAFARALPLWGGFLAIKKIDPMYCKEILHKLNRDVTLLKSTELLVGLSEIYTHLEDISNGAKRVFTEVYDALYDGGQPPDRHIVATSFARTDLELIQKILNSCSQMISAADFNTMGMYMSSTLANPTPTSVHDQVWSTVDGQTETGLTFRAYIKQFAGL